MCVKHEYSKHCKKLHTVCVFTGRSLKVQHCVCKLNNLSGFCYKEQTKLHHKFRKNTGQNQRDSVLDFQQQMKHDYYKSRKTFKL